MAEAVVSFVVENISDLLIEKAQILNGEVSGQVEEVVAKFRWMQSFLRDADARQKEGRVGKWIADLRELVYDAQDELESFVLKASSLKKGGTKNIIKRCLCVLDNERVYRHKFGREMEAIQRRMAELSTRLHEYNIKSIAPVASSSHETPGKLKRFYSHVVVEPQVVGLQEDVESLVAHLVNESDDECYRVVSICGMGGIGKTTLAQKIYNHPTIKTHFSGNLAWVSISQKWELKNVLQRIIFCLVQDPKQRNEIMKFEDDKILECLHQLQQSRKCLVVLDDIWSTDAWDGLKAAFPIQHLKSKLMLTSRNVQVCKHVDPKGFLHQPRLLNEQQSWELLQMKALPKQNSFDTRSYVKEMEELGREMVGHCKGLPLAIVVLGGILVTKPTLTEWEKVHQEIQSSIRSGKRMGEEHQREVLDILVLSYNDLPYQLKPCFLYLSKFGEDADIDAEKLYQLWIAEGLVLSSDRRDDETMMDVAESYLAELVHRCMVQVEFEDEELSLRKFRDEELSLRKFRSCRLHDLMTDLSLSKAVEEDFFKVFYLRRGSDYHHDEQSVEYFAYTRRLVIFYSEGGESRDMRSTISSRKDASRSLRSVLLFNVGMRGMERLPPIFRILNQIGNFRLLRVLSFEGFSYVEEGLTLKGVVLGTLVHLRYLSLKDTLMLKFPTFIENLEQLQTLDLRFYIGYISSSAKHIVLKMEHLRHLYLPYLPYYKEIVEDQEKLKLGFDGLSKKLETLENFDTRWCELKDLQKLNSLRKLTVTTTNNRVELEEIMQYFSKASSSLRYTSLTIRLLDEYNLGWGNGSSPLKQLLWSDRCKLNLLRTQGPIGDLLVFDNNSHTATSALTTVMFESSGLEEDPMPVLERIPTLRKLLLWDDAVHAREMVCSAMGFPQLIRLVLHHMPNLEKWRVDRGSMPNLSRLIISECVKLEELPEGLKFINSLQHLEIIGMPKQFCDRIRSVDGEQGPDFCKVAHVPAITFSDDFPRLSRFQMGLLPSPHLRLGPTIFLK